MQNNIPILFNHDTSKQIGWMSICEDSYLQKFKKSILTPGYIEKKDGSIELIELSMVNAFNYLPDELDVKTCIIPIKEGTSGIIEKYAEENGYKVAKKIDEKMSALIKDKPKWCPFWLYKKIIKESVEIVKIT
jgi:hypothetical protein